MDKELLQKHILDLLLAEKNIKPAYQQEMDEFIAKLSSVFKNSYDYRSYNTNRLNKLITKIELIKTSCDERIKSIERSINSDNIHVNHQAVNKQSFSIEYYFKEFEKELTELKFLSSNDYAVRDYIESKHATETALIRHSHHIVSKYCPEFPVLENDKISILDTEMNYIVSCLTVDSMTTNKKYKLYAKPILKTKVSTKSDVFTFDDFSRIVAHEKRNEYWKYIDAAYEKQRIGI